MQTTCVDRESPPPAGPGGQVVGITVCGLSKGDAIGAVEKIKIGGLKFSGGQVQLTLPEPLAGTSSLTAILHGLAQHKVNLSFLCADQLPGPRAGFCLAPEDLACCRSVIDERFPVPAPRPEISEAIGTLLIFPHHSKMAVLGRVLSVFGRCRLPLLTLCSSLSGLAVNTGLQLLERVADELQTVFELPKNHAPFRPQPIEPVGDGRFLTPTRAVVETAASYWEPLIRMYGVNRRTGLTMTSLVFHEQELESWGRRLQELDDGLGSFAMVAMQRLAGRLFRLVVFDRGALAEICTRQRHHLVARQSAELLYLHGPHFQDRYGVVHAALGTLHKHGLDILAVGCTGSSIFLATPENRSCSAAEALTELFIVPNV